MAEMINEMANEDPGNKYLKDLAENLEKNPPVDVNGGHDALMQDLVELVKQANNYDFHDFRNKNYSAPKFMLRQRLTELANNVVAGKYDN